MKLRVSRHTNQLNTIKKFYIDVLGFEFLGDFHNHDNYNGIFLTKGNSQWHLEFTESNIEANHVFDEDDIMVLYVESKNEMALIEKQLKAKGIKKIKAQNPYWNRNGIMIQDPDGYRIIFALNKN